MGSTKRPFMKKMACPIASEGIALHGVLVELSGANSQGTRESCSNIEEAIQAKLVRELGCGG